MTKNKPTSKAPKGKKTAKAAKITVKIARGMVKPQKVKPKLDTRATVGNRGMPSTVKKTDHGMSKFRMALIDPFDVRAEGARVPSPFNVNTNTFIARGYMKLRCGPSGNDNSYFVSPSPAVSFVTGQSPISNSSVLPQGMTPFSTSSGWYAAVPNPTMQDTFSSYRIVGAGVRLRNLLPSTSAPVIINIAKIPIVDAGPGPNTLNVQTVVPFSASMQTIVGAAPNATNNNWGSTLFVQPTAQRFTTQDIIDKSLTIPFRPTSAQFTEFKTVRLPSAGNVVAGYTTGDYLTVNGAGVVAGNTDEKESYTAVGWDGLAIQMSQNGSIADGTDVLELEYIYHLEGTPRATSSSAAFCAIAPSGIQAQPTSSWEQSAIDLAWAYRQEIYRVGKNVVGGLFSAGATNFRSYNAIQN